MGCYRQIMRIAIIDLGTNTFNLLIADTSDRHTWNQVFKVKEAVKLGEGGINKGYILPEAYARGMAALNRHRERIEFYGARKVFAFGTSALRDAANGPGFIREVKQRFGFDVVLISGEKEAELIYKGVRQTVGTINEKFLILDIGGGSNEFIIAGQQQFYWKESFKLGMARLMDRFSPPDPISPALIVELEQYFESELTSLFSAVEQHKVEILVGASGSFDSLVNMYYADIYSSEEVLPASQELDIAIFKKMHDMLINSVRAEREKMKGLEPVRRDMIVLAVVFVNFILKRLKIKKLYQSSYSLKEGALWEVMQNV